MSEAVSTSSLTPLLKSALREVAMHDGMTAREVSLGMWVPEAKARMALDKLKRFDLVVSRYNGRAVVWIATGRGRATVELMSSERIARTQQEAILASANPAAIVVCPACRGERVFCSTCRGCRMVTAEQVAR